MSSAGVAHPGRALRTLSDGHLVQNMLLGAIKAKPTLRSFSCGNGEICGAAQSLPEWVLPEWVGNNDAEGKCEGPSERSTMLGYNYYLKDEDALFGVEEKAKDMKFLIGKEPKKSDHHAAINQPSEIAASTAVLPEDGDMGLTALFENAMKATVQVDDGDLGLTALFENAMKATTNIKPTESKVNHLNGETKNDISEEEEEKQEQVFKSKPTDSSILKSKPTSSQGNMTKGADEDKDVDNDSDRAADSADAAAAKSDEFVVLLQNERVKATSLVSGNDMKDDIGQRHAYWSDIDKESSKGGTRSAKSMKRILKELKKMKKHLPISRGASIFLCFDKDKPYCMRALVSGPIDTPYYGGLYAFDIYCPPTYPQSPPCVRLLTTGRNTVRFSPNLYREGKVCLSLLGTWNGPGWDPKTSSILQVLVSIQSLVFVERPHEMEPGFGGWGEKASKINEMKSSCAKADKAKTGTVSFETMVKLCKQHDNTDNWGGSDPEGTIESFILASGCVEEGPAEEKSTGDEAKTLSSKTVRYKEFIADQYLTMETTRYNARIHASNLQWAINDMISNGSTMYPEFAKVIKCYFEQKKDSISRVLRAWEKQDAVLKNRHKLLLEGILQFSASMAITVLTPPGSDEANVEQGDEIKIKDCLHNKPADGSDVNVQQDKMGTVTQAADTVASNESADATQSVADEVPEAAVNLSASVQGHSQGMPDKDTQPEEVSQETAASTSCYGCTLM